jgi:hypothetical protein
MCAKKKVQLAKTAAQKMKEQSKPEKLEAANEKVVKLENEANELYSD